MENESLIRIDPKTTRVYVTIREAIKMKKEGLNMKFSEQDIEILKQIVQDNK